MIGPRVLLWGGMGLLVLATLLLLTGCQGHQAMIWRKPQQYRPPCVTRVCEHRGPGRIDYKRDCKCSSRTVGEILENL